MNEHPQGVWIWELSKVRQDYLEQLNASKIKRVYLKVFDGKKEGQLKPTFWEWQCSLAIVKNFQSRGIQVYGWGYHYWSLD